MLGSCRQHPDSVQLDTFAAVVVCKHDGVRTLGTRITTLDPSAIVLLLTDVVISSVEVCATHLPVTCTPPGLDISTDGTAGIDQLLVHPTALAPGSTTTNLPPDTTDPVTLNDSVAVSVTPGVRVPATHDIGLASTPAVITSVATFVGPSIIPPFKSFVVTTTFAAAVALDGLITRVTLNTII